MYRFIRRVGALKFALIYISIAAALSVVLDWLSISMDQSNHSHDDIFYFLDQIVLLSITAIALFTVVSAVISESRTERKQLEDTLIAYDQLFKTHTQPMWLVDADDRRILDVNKTAIKRYGWSREEFLALTADDLQFPPPQTENELETHLQNFLEGTWEHIIAKRHRNRAGVPFWVELTTHPVHFDGVDMLLVTAVDISVQVEAARRARKALKHLEDAEKLGRFGSWEWYPGSPTVNASKGFLRLLDAPEDQTELPLQVAIDRVHPEDRHIPKAAVEKCLKTGSAEARFRGMLPNGEIHYYREIFHRQAYNGQEHVLMGSIIDDTDQLLYTQTLERQESDLRTMLINLPAPVVLHEPGESGSLVMANPAFYCMLGIPAGKEASIKSLDQAGAGPEQQRLLKELFSLNVSQPTFTRKQEVLLRRSNGYVFRVHLHCTQLRLSERLLVQMVIHDVDDEVVLREQLRQANSNLSKLNSKTIKVLEQERALISRELHDDIGQLLIAVKTNTRSLFNKWPAGEPKPGEADLISDILEELVAKVRDRSLMLRPPQLDELGLKHAISWEMRRVLGPTAIQSQFHDRISIEKMPPEPTLTAFRIFQEAMANSVRHAAPNRLDVILEADASNLKMIIEDDGKGFDIERKKGGLGLANMSERASLVAGTLVIDSSPGKGTRIEASLPLDRDTLTQMA